MRSRQLWKKGIVLIPFLAVTLFADNQAKSQSWSPQVSITWGPGSPPYYAGGAGSGYTAEDPNTLFILSNSLSPCQVNDLVDCIQSIEVKPSNGDWTELGFIEPAFPSYGGDPTYLPNHSWGSNVALNLGPANNSNLYIGNLNGLNNVQFFVRAQYDVYSTRNTFLSKPRTYNFQISPVRREPMNTCLSSLGGTGYETNAYFNRTYMPGITAPYCYLRLDDTFRYRISLNMKYQPVGWIETTIGDAKFKSETLESNNLPYRIVIEGDSLKIPATQLIIDSANKTDTSIFCDSKIIVGKILCNPDNRVNWSAELTQPSQNGLDAVAIFREALSLFPRLDTATDEYTSWKATIRTSDSRNLFGCQSSEAIYGIVGGNAMLIGSELPLWDENLQNLNFSVQSPHFLPSGAVSEGVYEMQLNKDVAKCLWKTTVEPSNVELSVIEKDGKTKSAVAVVSTYANMIKFRATGFHYSETILRASLNKKKPTSQVQMMKRISCSKGRATKLQPRGTTKCPKGWKKRSQPFPSWVTTGSQTTQNG